MFEQFVIDCDKLDEYIAESELLKAHAFYLKQIKRAMVLQAGKAPLPQDLVCADGHGV